MKKIIAMLLALVMICSLATVAFAEDGETTKTAASKEATYTAVIKTYTVNGATNVTESDEVDESKVYPTETLSFTSVADTSNPDGGAANLTIDDLVISTAGNQNLQITVPSLNKVGIYHFTISEAAGNAQGVTYSTGTVAVSVLVEYDYEDKDNDNYTMTATVGITNGAAEGEAASKNDTFTNIYDLGSLSVTKKVTGNLGDTAKEFDVTVTFKAEKNVESTITYVEDGEVKTIANDWTGEKAVVIKLHDGETVTFTNIPAGVTYTVVESDYTTGEKNSENGYDAPSYAFSDDAKAIAKEDSDTVEITNNKETEVDTGIAMDSMPYVLILAVAMGGLVLFTTKKRVQE